MHIYPPKERRPRGFTLIELLVVVAIIALLISILLPSLSRARESARMVACQSNLKQFGVGTHMYADDEDGYFAPNWASAAYGSFFWYRNTKFRNMIGLEEGSTVPAGYICPNAPAEEAEIGHWSDVYGMNGNGGDGDSAATGNEWVLSNINTLLAAMRTAVEQPARTIQMADATVPSYSGTPALNPEDRWATYGDTSIHRGGYYTISYRHNDDEGMNALHFDGHASYYTMEEAYPDDITAVQRLWWVYKD